MTAAVQDIERQRDEILAAMQQMVSVPPEPGEVQPGEIVHRGDERLDAQIVVGKGKGAPILYIYDTRTGERSRTNANMLPTQLSKQRPDGSQVFTLRDPGITPKRGTLKCLLHPEGPNRATYDQWGLGVCRKASLPSRQDVKTHMQNRHKREWATIEEERLRIEREEERELRLAAIAQNKAATEALYRSAQSYAESDGASEEIDTPRRRGRPSKDQGGAA